MRRFFAGLLAAITPAGRRAYNPGEGPGSDRTRPWIRRPGRNRRSAGGANLAVTYRIPGRKARRGK